MIFEYFGLSIIFTLYAFVNNAIIAAGLYIIDHVFFSLDNVSDIVYYYTHNKEKLESDFELMGKIKEAVSEKKEEGLRVTYGIFETDYEQDYIYCLNHSSVIQK